MRRPEQDLHKDVACLFRAILPPEVVWLHVPNGGGRSKVEAGILKAMGVRAGVPDLLLMWSDEDGSCRVAWIELKAGIGRPSDAQRDFHTAVRALGHDIEVARSIEDVLILLSKFGVPHRRLTLNGTRLVRQPIVS